MNSINPYTQGVVQAPTKTTKVEQPKVEVKELTTAEIIKSKDLTPEQKLEKLGIKPMTAEELATNLATKFLDGDI